MDTKKRILVIDDDPDISLACAAILEHQGFAISTALSAKEGEAAIRAEEPDLVILDIIMEYPDSGFTLADIIARDFPDIPVIMMSSISDASAQIFDTSTLPVAAMLPKPIEPDELCKTVNRLLNDTSS